MGRNAHFDAWRADLEQQLRAEEDHPVLLSHVAKYRSLVPSLALIVHLIDCVGGEARGPVSRGRHGQGGGLVRISRRARLKEALPRISRAGVLVGRAESELPWGSSPSSAAASDPHAFVRA